MATKGKHQKRPKEASEEEEVTEDSVSRSLGSHSEDDSRKEEEDELDGESFSAETMERARKALGKPPARGGGAQRGGKEDGETSEDLSTSAEMERFGKNAEEAGKMPLPRA